MRSIASLRKQLIEMADDETFVERVQLRVKKLLATRSAIPCAKQIRKANAFICHAIRCVRISKVSVGCIARPFTGERTLTKGRIFDVGMVEQARPTLLDSGAFATQVMMRNRLGRHATHLVKFKGRIHIYEKTTLLYPEWCGLPARRTT